MSSFSRPARCARRWLAPLAATLLACPAAGAAATPRTEVQINLCGDPARIVERLKLKADAQPRKVWYFETPTLALYARGIVFRLRDGGDAAELTLKAARQDCATVPPALLPPAEGKCEIDWHGTEAHGAVSLSRHLAAEEAAKLRDGRAPLASALSAAQVRFLRERLGTWPLPEGIGALGPATVNGYRSAAGFSVEAWVMPSGPTFVEISQKTSREAAPRVRDDLLATLARAKVDVCADQSTRADDKLELLRR